MSGRRPLHVHPSPTTSSRPLQPRATGSGPSARPRGPQAALAALLALVALGSPDAAASTYVGNPKLAVRLAPASGLAFTGATTSGPTVHLEDCGPSTVGTGSTDVHGSQLTIEPAFCAATLVTDGTLTITGTGPQGSSFTLELTLDEVSVDLVDPEGMGPLDDGAAYLLELADPDWTSASQLGLQASTHTSIDSEDTVHDTLVDALVLDAQVFVDTDGDGVLSGSERAGGGL